MIKRREFNGALLASAVIAALDVGAANVRAAEVKRAVFLINGTLGDKSYFDLGADGMHQIKAKYGEAAEIKIIEMGNDQSKWEPTLEDISEQDWDLIFCCTFDISDVVADVAPRYPNKKYVLIDGVVAYESGKFGNIYSIFFKQNEGSYLAGMLAAGLVADGTIPASQGTSLGFLGGMDIPVINDFLVGYIEGAQAINPKATIAVSYAGTFADAAKGKELALAQYRSGTAIGFNVAGLTGLGQLAAAKETGKFAIGVNSDQEAVFKSSDPEMSSRVVTSMLKRVDVAMVRAFDLMLKDEMPIGKTESIGLAEGAVGLVEGSNMAKVASPELRKKIQDAKASIIGGQIKVGTAFGADTKTIVALRDSVRP